MARFAYSTLIYLTVLCAISGVSVAQSTSQAALQSCAAASPMTNVNVTQFAGIWFEVARNPAALTTMECVQLNFTVLSDNTTLNLRLTYSNTPSSLWQNSTVSANITMSNATTGYNITYTPGSASMPVTTIKLLDTNYVDYALVCGYTNQSDLSTAFGAVLTRLRVPTQSNLNSYEQTGSDKYLNFWSSNMTNITQSSECWTNGKQTILPMFTVIFAALIALLQYLH